MKSKAAGIVLLSLSLIILAPLASYGNSREGSSNQGRSFGREHVASPSPEAADPKWNAQARLLAGLIDAKDSAYEKIANSPEYKKHKAEMDRFWNQVQEDNLDRISAWRSTELGFIDRERPVFYPLSGVDLLNALAFFPDAPSYLLVALEPTGSVPDLASMPPERRAAGFASIRETIWSLAYANYLKSRVMRANMSNKDIRGGLPLFLIFLARLGQEVISVDHVGIAEDGQLVQTDFGSGQVTQLPEKKGDRRKVAGKNSAAPKNADTASGKAVPAIGVTIRFRVNGKVRSLTYLQMRLGNDVVSPATKEGRFFLARPRTNTIMKSAVYLLHSPDFAKLRDFILHNSKAILQDDSGIPYASFAQDKWDVHLFGSYTRPGPVGGIAVTPYQKDLVAAYKTINAPLPFYFGYGILWGKNRSNLMVFSRREN